MGTPHTAIASLGAAPESSGHSRQASDIVAGAVVGWREKGVKQLNNKKEPPSPAAQSDNREASNRVDRSHSTSRRWTITVMKEKA